MEIENKSKIAFLDVSAYREPYGHLTSSVCMKPSHTDKYLAYDSHHPQSVKRVLCLYDRAKRLLTKPSVIAGEKKHPSSVLVSNGCPSSFVLKISKASTAPRMEPVAEFKSTAVCIMSSSPLPRITWHSQRLYYGIHFIMEIQTNENYSILAIMF